MSVTMIKANLDVDLEERVRNLIHSKNRSALRRIEIQVQDGVIILKGTVASFYERQICLSCCRSMPEVSDIIDHLEVER